MKTIVLGAQSFDDVVWAPGKTLAENLESVPDLKQGQQVIMPLEQPIKASGHLQVLLSPHA